VLENRHYDWINSLILSAMKLPQITESMIQSHATANSLSRGRDYYHSGAVSDVTQRNTQIQADVEGSEFSPYRVSVQFDTGGITSARCTCPYDYDGWCKHIVATLEQLLDLLDHLQTQRLVQALVTEKPDLIDAIDRQVTRLTVAASSSKKSTKTSRRSAIDPQPFRRQVKQIIRDGLREAEYGCEEDLFTEALQDVIAQAQEFTEQG
jgi:uncharacterized Zn finger protein